MSDILSPASFRHLSAAIAGANANSIGFVAPSA